MKKLIRLLLCTLLLVNLTGCISDANLTSIKNLLYNEKIIQDNWQYVDELKGKGPDVGSEQNPTEHNNVYEIYKDSLTDTYICIVIQEIRSYEYEVNYPSLK